jgi:hypothetical protein
MLCWKGGSSGQFPARVLAESSGELARASVERQADGAIVSVTSHDVRSNRVPTPLFFPTADERSGFLAQILVIGQFDLMIDRRAPLGSSRPR